MYAEMIHDETPVAPQALIIAVDRSGAAGLEAVPGAHRPVGRRSEWGPTKA
jgi:hypothetical protein